MAFNPFMIGFTNSLMRGVNSYYDEQFKEAAQENAFNRSIFASLLKSDNPDLWAAAITGLQNPEQFDFLGRLKKNPAFDQIRDIVSRMKDTGDKASQGVPVQQAAQQTGLPQAVKSAQDSGALPQTPGGQQAIGQQVPYDQSGAGTNPIASIETNPSGMGAPSFPPTPFEQYASTQTGVTPTANQVPVPSARMSTNVPSQGGGGDQGGQINPAPAAATAPPPAIATPAQTTPTPATAPPTGAPAATATVGAPALGPSGQPGAPPPPPESFDQLAMRARGALHVYEVNVTTKSVSGKPTQADQIIENELARTAAIADQFHQLGIPLNPQTYQQFMNTLHPEVARTQASIAGRAIASKIEVGGADVANSFPTDVLGNPTDPKKQYRYIMDPTDPTRPKGILPVEDVQKAKVAGQLTVLAARQQGEQQLAITKAELSKQLAQFKSTLNDSMKIRALQTGDSTVLVPESTVRRILAAGGTGQDVLKAGVSVEKKTANQINTGDQAKVILSQGNDLIQQLRDPAFQAKIGSLLTSSGSWDTFMEQMSKNGDPQVRAFQSDLDGWVSLHPYLHKFRGGSTVINNFKNSVGSVYQSPEALAAGITGLETAARHFSALYNTEGENAGKNILTSRNYKGPVTLFKSGPYAGHYGFWDDEQNSYLPLSLR